MPDLSMIAEDAEDSIEEESVREGSEDLKNRDDEDIRSQSNWSQTTAAEALDELDLEYITSCLPGLLASSTAILKLLAPRNQSAAVTRKIIQDLKMLGSQTGKSLNYKEKKFEIEREHYGPANYHVDRGQYIQIPQILRKLFDTGPSASGERKVFDPEDIEFERFRPNAILQAANLANMLRQVLVLQREMASATMFLSRLDSSFPSAFLSQFNPDANGGNSALFEQSFALALNIRIQLIITELQHGKDGPSGEWDPEKILTDGFIEPLESRNEIEPYFEDHFINSELKPVMGKNVLNSDEQIDVIRERIDQIRAGFRTDGEAIEAGDLVNFEYLEETFPWVGFLIQAVELSRLRFNEINSSIVAQGGIDKIMKEIIDAVRAANPKAKIDSSQSSQNSQPPSAVKPAIPGKM